MYNIAQFGAFDFENYGDLLFPFILEQSLKKSSNIDKIVLFSPIGGKMPFNSDVDVYPIDRFEELQEVYHFRAIIVGGGDIIHFDCNFAAGVQCSADKASVKLWIYSAMLAEKYEIPLIWNCPGVPFAFSNAEISIATEVLKAVDYISVRDERSKRLLSTCCNPEKIFVYPDSALKISSLISKQEIAEIHTQLRNCMSIPGDDYIVFQLNSINEEDVNIYADTLLKIKHEYKLNIVLLPLGYVHQDMQVLEKIYNYYPEEFVFIRQKLLPVEMLSIIACSRFFIGSSLHGNISAFTYKVNSIAINIADHIKVKGFFEMIGKEKSQIQKSSDLYDCFHLAWEEKIVNPQEFIQQVDKHISNMKEKIIAGAPVNKDLLYNLCLQIAEIDYLYKKLEAEDNRKIEYLHQEIAQVIDQKNKEIETKQRLEYELEKKHNNIAQWEASYYAINNSTSWKMTKPFRRVANFLKTILRKNNMTSKFYKGLAFLKHHGMRAAYRRLLKQTGDENSFRKYYKMHIRSEKQLIAEKNAKYDKNIKISILVPLYNTPKNYLVDMMQSVVNQTYANWELCLADGSDLEHTYVGDYCRENVRRDSRIKYKKLQKNMGISDNTNCCIEMATGDYLGLFDHDDVLNPSALYEVMKFICEEDADFIYTDEATFEDKLDNLVNIHFKPDFAIDNLRANNYICHFTIFKKELIEITGGFRSECNGSQDYDMVLRLTEKAKKIAHIPKVLYYWRAHQNSVASAISAKPYVIEAAKKAISDHLDRNNIIGNVVDSSVISTYKINYKIDKTTLVSIIIPNSDHLHDLKACINSIINISTYSNYEIIIVENNSVKEETFACYKEIENNSKIKVVYWDGPFNYSAINNYAEQYAKGEYLLFLNNDVEVITADWIEEMLMYAQRNDVGAVGAKLYYPDDTVQHAGIGIGLLALAGHYHRNFPRRHPGYMARLSYAQNVSAVTAACLMMKRNVFKKLHGFDESFEVAFNDVDLCMRIRQLGYLIVFTPYAELYHYESKSRGSDDTPEKRERFVGEVHRFQKKWKKELSAGDPYYNSNLSLDFEDFSINI